LREGRRVSDAAALMIVRGADFTSVFDKPQRDALAVMFLELHRRIRTSWASTVSRR